MSGSRLRTLVLLLIWLVLLVLAAATAWLRHSVAGEWLDARLECTFFELRGPRAVSDAFVVVGMDDATHSALPLATFYWGWYHAEVIRKLAQGGARGIALDMFAPEIDGEGFLQTEQERLARRLEYESFAAMGTAIAEARYEYDCPVFLACYVRGGELQLPRDELREPAGGDEVLGFVNLFAEESGDKAVREFGTLLPAQGGSPAALPSLPGLAATHASRGTLELAEADSTGPESVFINYTGPPNTYPHLSYLDVLSAEGEELEKLSSQWRGRTVFIGKWQQPDDIFVTPYAGRDRRQRMSGVELLANVADTVYTGRELKSISGWTLVLLAALLLLLSAIAVLRLAPPLSVATDLVLAAGILAGSYAAFLADLRLAPGALLLVLVIGSGLVRVVRFTLIDRERRRVADYFRRYVSRRALQRIVEERGESLLAGERCRAVVMFADIRGFTTFTQGLPPAEVVAFLTRYHDAMTEIVTRHGGWVDKFIGDGALVVFGYPEELPHPAAAGLACAREMVRAASALPRPDTGQASLSIGVGLHYGEIVGGNVGSRAKLDFTVIGDSVNLASRLQDVCKQRGVAIVATAELVALLDAETATAARELGEVPIRGHAQARLFAFD